MSKRAEAADAKSLPYSYGFENGDLAAEGWTRVDCLDNSKIYGSVASHSGSRGFGFYQTSSAQYLISPEIDSDGKDYSVSFYYKHLNDANSFQVGYSTTTSDLSAFTWANVTPIKGDWQLYKLDYSADVKYIALKGIITSDAFLLDDFSFVVSGCLPPTDLAASGITDHVVTLTWTAPSTTSTITGYTYQIKKQGDSWGTDTEVMDSSFTSVTFDNLSENTDYDFRVNTLYAEGESPDYETISFITDASGSVSLPFSEDFENGMGAWRVVNGDANTKIHVPYGKTNAFSFWGDAPQYLISPQLDCSAEITVSLKYCISDANMPKVFQVGYSTTTKDISAFTWDVGITGTVWDYEEYTCTFPAATKYIAIKYCSNSTKYLHIDDINVFVDGALPPTGLTASTIACQSTTITWDTVTEATGYAYQYKKVSDSTWSTESSTTSTSVTISGLMSDTDYDFRLKAIYGSNESIYTGAQFITATALPYEMNFEDGYGRWTMVDCTNSFDDTVNDSWRTGRRTQAAHDSGVGFQFHENYDSSEPQYLISPRFAGDTAVTLSFYYRVPTNIEATIYVGYSTTTNDKDAFTFGDAISFDSSSWAKYENTFPADACYFAIKYTSNEYLAYIDDICFEKSSTYAKPTAIGCTALSETEATIGWNVPEGVTGFIYQYKKATDSVWSAEASLNTNRVTLSGLTPNTYYNFRVKAIYGSNDSTYATYNFQTYANVVDLPFSDGFENGMGAWRMKDCDGQSAIRKNSDSHNGISYFAFGAANQEQLLISPHFAGGVPIKVSFYYRNHENYQGAFAVGYATGIDAGITWIDNAIIANGGEWTLYETTLPATAQYCIICCRKEGKMIYLDDFCFEELTEKDASFVVAAPTANSLAYNSSAQELVNAGVADGGTMVYSLEENGTYSADIPTGIAVDTYKVWYYVKGDPTHYDTDKKSLEVKITKADIKPAVSVTGWTFGDNPNQLSVSGNPGNGDVAYQYKVQGADDNTYADDIPTEAGSYTVRASIEETQNYKAGTATANFTISKLQNPKVLTDLSRSISKTNTSVNASVATLVLADAGPVSAFSVNGFVTTTGSVMVSNVEFDANGTLTADLSNSRPGDTITIPVKITAGNYDCTLNIVFSIPEEPKETPEEPKDTPEEPKTTPEEPKGTPEEPKKTYTVIWLDGNGKELDKKEYIEGDAEPKTDKTPTKADADSSYFVFEGWDNGKVDGTTKTYTPTFAKKPLYTSEIGTLEYTMGENKEAVVRIIGNRNNTGLVGRVKSIGTDTKNAVFGTDVLLREGSLIMTFAPGFLDSLGVGEHMIRVVFDDGEVSFMVRILAAIATGTPTPAPADTTPVTGDALPVVPFALVMIVTFAGAAGMVMYRRKRG